MFGCLDVVFVEGRYILWNVLFEDFGFCWDIVGKDFF